MTRQINDDDGGDEEPRQRTAHLPSQPRLQPARAAAARCPGCRVNSIAARPLLLLGAGVILAFQLWITLVKQLRIEERELAAGV
jgi:hypothetical protein